jgi:hypothetical protein
MPLTLTVELLERLANTQEVLRRIATDSKDSTAIDLHRTAAITEGARRLEANAVVRQALDEAGWSAETYLRTMAEVLRTFGAVNRPNVEQVNVLEGVSEDNVRLLSTLTETSAPMFTRWRRLHLDPLLSGQK